MLVLQHYTPAGWKTLGRPYLAADTARVQQAAATLSPVLGLVWRIVGMEGRVLSVFDGLRWHATAEAVPMPAEWWDQDLRTGFPDTIPTL